MDPDYLDWVREEGARIGLDSETVANCLEYASALCCRGLPVIYDDTHLALWLAVEPHTLTSIMHAPRAHYREFAIPKAAGGYRRISAPKATLLRCQRWVHREILSLAPVHPACCGFTRGSSAIVNASRHTGQECVLNVDLQDFFPSVSEARVFDVFRELGYSRQVAFGLTRVCTLDGRLPQGSPASPALSNIVADRLDRRLAGLARSAGAEYSRYADDLTFSGPMAVARLLPIVKRIVKSEGFRLNARKTSIMPAHKQQIVTGLVVNSKVSVPRAKRRRLRQIIYYCTRYGAGAHRLWTDHSQQNLRDHLTGWAYYIHSVDAELGHALLEALPGIRWD